MESSEDEQNEERWFDEMRRAKRMLSCQEQPEPADEGAPRRTTCCDERCCTSGSVRRIGERTYECSLHGRVHVCGTMDDDEHPVIVETETGGVCLFSGLVIDQNIVQDVMCPGASTVIGRADASGEGREEEDDGTSMDVDGRQAGSREVEETSSTPWQQQQRSEADMRNFCVRVMRKLFDQGKRQQCDERARTRAMSEAQTVDRAYVKGCLRDNVMTCAPRRRSLILATLARHARSPFVRVSDETIRRWAAVVDCVWRVLTRETTTIDRRDPSGGRRAVQTRRLTFVFGVLHFMGSPDGLRHESGVIVIRHDPEISACLPRPRDLETLGFRQRCESAGWKQLRVMVHGAVENIAQRLEVCKRDGSADVHSRAAIRLSAMIAVAISAQRRRGLT